MSIEIIRGEENAPIGPLCGAAIAIIGYGNQGAAQAKNLRDSGLSVVIGQRFSVSLHTGPRFVTNGG